MPPIARLQLTALGCPDPEALAAFYSAVTGWPVGIATTTGCSSTPAAARGSPSSSRPTTGPRSGPIPRTRSNCISTSRSTTSDVGERAMLALGAVKTGVQPEPDAFRVFLDPAGHPFCLVVASG